MPLKLFAKKSKNQKILIKFPVLLLLIFVTIQIVLFAVLDMHSVLDSNLKRPAASEQKDNRTALQKMLGAVLQVESLPPVAIDNSLTSIMIIGVDARQVELKDGEYINTNSADASKSRNNDAVIQVVLDHRNGNIFMISIPRDMGIDIRKDCLKFSGSFHMLYDLGQKSNCDEKGIGVLKTGIETVTGIKVQYYVIISLDAFQDIVDTVAQTQADGQKGIYVDNPRSFSDLYPKQQGGYESVHFPQGHLFLTPYRALQFARTRQLTSDFDRAKRQQLVIKAVLERAISIDVLTDPSRLQGIINTFNSKIIMSQPKDLVELTAMVGVIKGLDLKKIHNLVLDPSFGGGTNEQYLNRQPHDRRGPYYMVPTAWRQCPGNEFCKVQERIQEYIMYPDSIK